MTMAAKPGTYLGDILQLGDYMVERPHDAWSGAGTVVQVLVSGDPLWQRGRDVGAPDYTHERVHIYGVWSDWAVIGGVTLPVPQSGAPGIDNIDPATIEDDGEVQAIAINGTSFARGCTVEVNNSTAIAGAVTFTSDEAIAISLDTDDAGVVAPTTLSIVVVNPDGKRSNVALLPVTEPA